MFSLSVCYIGNDRNHFEMNDLVSYSTGMCCVLCVKGFRMKSKWFDKYTEYKRD